MLMKSGLMDLAGAWALVSSGPARVLGLGDRGALQPGKRAWPYHSHHVIEEFFFVLEGEGTLRHADEEYPIRKGDFICSPADAKQPHQIINTSDSELSYIALSTDEPADVMQYPDSGKYGVWQGSSKEVGSPDNFVVFARKETAVNYWDGEAEDE